MGRSKSKPVKVSDRIAIDTANKFVYLIDDGSNLTPMEMFYLEDYPRSEYSYRIVSSIEPNEKSAPNKKVRITKNWLLENCPETDRETLSKVITDAEKAALKTAKADNKKHTGSGLVGRQAGLKWFRENHPDLLP